MRRQDDVKDTHGAWLICNTDLDLSISACEVVPLVLADGADVVKVWGKLDASHEEVVAHVLCQAITGNVWFLCTEIALNGYLGRAGDIASDAVNGRGGWVGRSAYNWAWYM